ncbi:CaiB/BaiF CoA transferase family protein [Cupriavidus consociatus]|uniref:CaiB/BaiF CoA transferase family protein n=1 Tax=Cupriavidus consociatus TaxID=2821357 RepID=UPI001AE42ABC|nr:MULTISPECIES: CoA transferase [unclassified Cupriavidus]MBP0624354.1 CoA transferase [Cupriavidus sp. LEh25]MDK2661069.1 CoA transferase [Cupriavidus sp. LEh21]
MDTLKTLPFQTPGAGLSCLRGIRVLDFTTSVAGPYGTLLLADLGAEVLKVEKRHGGDDTRSWGPPFLDGESLWFLSMNRNKQSMTIDLTRPEGQRVAHELVRNADVVVLNSAQRVQEKLGLDYATLKAMNGRLIHVSVTGFGLEGDRADLPCYDLIAEGYSGVMHLTGEADGPPQKVGTPAADLLSGQDIAMATLAALFERERTGAGKQIDVSMVATMARFMAPRIVPYLGSGEAPNRSGGTDSVIAIYQVFDTADFPITLGLGNDAIWQRFWAAVGQPDYARQVGFETNARRREARQAIVQTIAKLLETEPRQHWLALFARHRIPSGPINSIDQLADDIPLRESGMFFATQGVAGLVPQVGLGIRFDGASAVLRNPPPALGEDTERILREELSMSATCIAGLIDSEIV